MMYNIFSDKKYSTCLQIDSLEKRLSKLNCSYKKNIIYIKDIFDVFTFRYRAYNVMQAMEKSEKYYVTCFLVEEINYLIENINKVDLVILQRCKWSFALESFVNFLKLKNIIIVYDMDDLIYNSKYVPEYLNSSGYYDDFQIDLHFALASRYEMIAKMCDYYIVTTDALKRKIEFDFQKKTYVYHNFLNKEQENISNDIIKIKESKKDKSKFIIGYFSGSDSHMRDFETVELALIKLMEKYDDIYLKIVGYMELSGIFKKLKEEGRIIFCPFVPYQELGYLIASVDVNIIPLQKNQFNECKSELKYFESSIVNTITVAYNNSVYSKIIDNGINGFLANDFEWYSRLEYIYLNYDKLDYIIKNARKYCIDKYSCYNQLHNLENLYDNFF